MVQVTLLDTMELATFCVRTFSLHKVNDLPFSVYIRPLSHCFVAVRNTLLSPERTVQSLS